MRESHSAGPKSADPSARLMAVSVSTMTDAGKAIDQRQIDQGMIRF